IKPGPSSESVLGCPLTMQNSHDFVAASAAAGYRCRTGSGDHGALASLLRRQRDRELGAVGMSKADVSGRATCDARGPRDAASGALLADRTVDERDGRRVGCSGWTLLIALL
ncbi:MAG: hypothetical protein WAK32_21800, partial [Xanthobacteraceae bacterium]